MGERFSDFTEAGYQRLLALARERYQFILFHEESDRPGTVLWRHDVDCSPQRALALAKIERSLDVRSTYFVHLHSHFYNALEPAVAEIFKEILRLGHEIGLHFEPEFYGEASSVRARLEDHLAFERHILQQAYGCVVRAFSFHNPTEEWLAVEDHLIGGLVNTYARAFRERCRYYSDSNGYFRADVVEALEDPSLSQLHILTHPEWWVESQMSPRQRIARCIDGRAASTASWYDNALASMGRQNIK